MRELTMKLSWAITGTVAASLLLVSACKRDEPPTPQEETTAFLIKPVWGDATVTIDDVGRNDLYTDLSIQFEKDTYTAENGLPVWLQTGTWKFKNKEARFIILDDDLEVEIISIDNRQMELSFQWATDSFEAGRVQSVKGKNKIKLKVM